jgi:hypothetical protein
MEYSTAMFHLADPSAPGYSMNTAERRPSPDLPFHGLWSLWDMLRFYADKFMSALNALDLVENISEKDAAWTYGDKSRRAHVCHNLQTLVEELKTLGLSVSAKRASLIKFSIENNVGGNDHKKLADYVKQALAVVRDDIKFELEERALFVITSNAEYLDDGALPFGQEVAFMFPGAAFDIAEAGKCLAFRRATACIFHLMRVIEIGIRSVGNDLGVTISPNAGWLAIINDKLEPAIDALPQNTQPEKDRKRELQQARAHLHAIRLGWRNDTMHPKETYTEDEAIALFGHVKTFMKHLAAQMTVPSEERPS